jgi:signal transduction histidine kinase
VKIGALLILILVSGLLISVAMGLTSHLINLKIISSGEKTYVTNRTLALSHVVEALRNEILNSNYRYVRNHLEAPRSEGFFSYFMLHDSSGNLLVHSGVEPPLRENLLKIQIPIYFNDGGEVFGRFSFFVDDAPIRDLSRSLFRATFQIVLIGTLIIFVIIVGLNFTYFIVAKDLLFFAKSGLTKNTSRSRGVLSFLFEPLYNATSRTIDEILVSRNQLETLSQQEALFKISRQVAHDIRSPISALKSSLPILSKDPTTASELLKMSIDRIDSIANDLLDRSRSKLSAVDLEQSVRRIVAEKISDPDISSQIKFSIDVQSDLPKVYAERAMIERMVSNLFNNSIEAMSSKGEINIKISRLGSDELQLTITDSGPGTSDEIITLLNQSPTSLGKKAGNGIGLIQAKTYIASIGGRILFSSSLGHGFTVEIIFPVWNDPA